MIGKWIWLPKSIYPQHQTTRFDALSDSSENTFCVAEFTRKYSFSKCVSKVTVTFSADTEVQLFCNGRLIATGPSSVGGDFLGNGKAREWYYANEVSFFDDRDSLDFFVRVKMCPIRICEYSKGHGGFVLSAAVTLSDGSTEIITTDESWLVRKNSAYRSPYSYDGRISPDKYVSAETVTDIWQAKIAPISVREEKEIAICEIQLAAGEDFAEDFDLDRICAGFIHIANTDGTVDSEMLFCETEIDSYTSERATLTGQDEYRGFQLHSVGNVRVKLKNVSDKSTRVKIGLITTYYPVTVEAETSTDDNELNELLSICKHTLKYCRQTHHLDSPRHCEPLACTGDYYIETLMTAFSFGDMRLAEFDVERTAELLRHNSGRMFHTTYSLIWVRMLYDVYMFGGNYKMLTECRDALDMLLSRFEAYIGENNLIENPPDYMFVDWIYIDGLSMHHPPKALGQTVLNMFYFMALDHAEKIYAILDDREASHKCKKNKEILRQAVNTLLYDSDKKMYFEGLNTPIPEEQINQWQPQNVEKRYYLKHSNIMAAYTSICDSETAKTLIGKIVNDEIEGDVQPYFLHYLLEAIYDHGLREKYTLLVLERWKNAIRECGKGLPEGFYAPEPNYRFDHSHAWGGTPLYSLPKALTGLSIEEPAYKKIKLSPSLLGLAEANVEIPTPYGMIRIEMEKGKSPKIVAPEGISITI